MIKKEPETPKPARYPIAPKLKEIVSKLKQLDGDPHYISTGVAIGVFIAMTPTIPFHSILAIILAFLFHASKAAAFIGAWASNPVTIPFIYLANYKIGMFLIGNSTHCDDKYQSIIQLCKLGFEVPLAMMAGGMILGIPVAFTAYFITRNILSTLRDHKR